VPTSTRKQRFALILGFLNLVVIMNSAGLLSWIKGPRTEDILPPILAETLGLYRGISGGFTSYAFFAPDVPSRLRLRFQLSFAKQPSGESRQDESVFLGGINREANIRIGDIEESLRSFNSDPKIRRALLASLSGKQLALHSEASEVEAEMQLYHVPSLAETKMGERPQWLVVYSAVFRRGLPK
jgi:hypothetical protein